MFKKLIEKLEFNINKISFETRDNLLFLDIEIEDTSLEEIVKKTKIISSILDEIDFSKENYFLNVFSPGIEKEIPWENLSKVIGKNIFIGLRENIFNSLSFEGELLEFDSEKLKLKINKKGLITKKEFYKKHILYIKESIKVKNGK
ncbi:MAG: hypothetical protein ACRDBR_02995 [Metamycoplasmataceae bacterium]